MPPASFRLVAKYFCLVSAVAFGGVGHAISTPNSIVGRWALNPDNCSPAGGMIVIEPMRMVGDEFRCSFDAVSRTGETVVWRGSCGFPDPPRKAVVVAKTNGAALHVRFDGDNSGPYFRCRK